MGFQISLCKFQKNSLNERLLEGKALTLWDQLTEHKAFSQKDSFLVLIEENSFFTIVLYGLPNITLQFPEEQSLRRASGGESFSSVRWIKRTQSERLLEGKAVILWDELTEHKAVSQKASFQFLTEDLSFFTIALYGFPNITLQISQEQS